MPDDIPGSGRSDPDDPHAPALPKDRAETLRLDGGQMLAGTVRHADTGAYVVFLSLDGDDVRQVACHRDPARAEAVRQESERAVTRLLARRMRQEETDDSAETAEMARLLRRWQAESDAPFVPFGDDQLQVIGASIQDALRKRRSLPPPAPGTARVIVFAPEQPVRSTTTELPPPLPLMPSRPARRKRRGNA